MSSSAAPHEEERRCSKPLGFRQCVCFYTTPKNWLVTSYRTSASPPLLSLWSSSVILKNAIKACNLQHKVHSRNQPPTLICAHPEYMEAPSERYVNGFTVEVSDFHQAMFVSVYDATNRSARVRAFKCIHKSPNLYLLDHYVRSFTCYFTSVNIIVQRIHENSLYAQLRLKVLRRINIT